MIKKLSVFLVLLSCWDVAFASSEGDLSVFLKRLEGYIEEKTVKWVSDDRLEVSVKQLPESVTNFIRNLNYCGFHTSTVEKPQHITFWAGDGLTFEINDQDYQKAFEIHKEKAPSKTKSKVRKAKVKQFIAKLDPIKNISFLRKTREAAAVGLWIRRDPQDARRAEILAKDRSKYLGKQGSFSSFLRQLHNFGFHSATLNGITTVFHEVPIFCENFEVFQEAVSAIKFEPKQKTKKQKLSSDTRLHTSPPKQYEEPAPLRRSTRIKSEASAYSHLYAAAGQSLENLDDEDGEDGEFADFASDDDEWDNESSGFQAGDYGKESPLTTYTPTKEQNWPTEEDNLTGPTLFTSNPFNIPFPLSLENFYVPMPQELCDLNYLGEETN